MPTKRNRAGKQQNYIEAGHGDASGEYGDNATGSNKHFTSFKKPDGEKAEIETPLSKENELKYLEDGIENYANLGEKEQNSREEYSKLSHEMARLFEEGKLSEEKFTELFDKLEEKRSELTKLIKEKWDNYYGGQGNSKLQDILTNRLSNAKGKVTPNGKLLLDQIKDADDEMSGVISDYYFKNPNTHIQLGKNLNSSYRTTSFMGQIFSQEVLLGSESLGGANSINYTKGSGFFHESGHALNHTLGIGKAWSEDYKSKIYNSTLSEEIYNEIRQNVNFDEIKKEYDDMVNSYITPEYQALQDRQTQIEKETAELGKKAQNSPKCVELKTKLDEARKNKCDAFRNGNYEEMRKYQNEAYSLQDEWEKEYKSQFPSGYKNMIDERNKIIDELYNRKQQARGEANRKFGDLSDMCQATLGKKLGMGHKDTYFYDDSNRGDEAFAEIMSAKATNKESYEVMKKYIPRTLQIFDEIILNIKKGKKG